MTPRVSRISVLSQWFQDLTNGDPVAWAVVGIFAAFLFGFGLFALKVIRDLRKEDEATARRQGRKN